ncbi:MAG: bifunctional 3-(3-hydroxy-phenyl)propionate/3-hydroxycinnamic acid hydroxylase [Acidimicrobiia bacterium]
MSAPSEPEQINTDVLIVGAGPCGITLANLFGVYGINAVLIDRETSIIDFPRAVGIDDESLRTCQAAGAVNEVLRDCVQNTPIRYYTSWGRCFAHVKPSAQPFGWPRRNLFLQPMFEATMRDAVKRFDRIDVRLGHELQSFVQDASGVTAQISAPGGSALTVRASYLVGTDGGRSTVRRLAGIEMTGSTDPMKWLVVDVADDVMDAPYSAVFCDSVQPVLMVPLPYRHRRWEFKLSDGQDEAAVVQPEHVMELLRPRYGSTPLPRIMSSRVYLHHSRIADRFQVGRVFVAGDAAHLQPPFFGQGMNSGMRDVTNLAWKLAAVVKGNADASVVDTYDTERRAHAREMVGFATRIGKMYIPRNTITEHARDVMFRFLQFIPGGKEYVLQMKFKPMPRYTSGVMVGVDHAKRSQHPVGRMFNQPAVETMDRRRLKLDDAVGPWFAVIGIGCDPSAGMSDTARTWWEHLGARIVRVDSPRTRAMPGDDSASATAVDSDGGRTLALADVDGGFRDWKLARPGDEVIVLRPDRYVAAVCTLDELESVTAQLRTVMSGAGTRAGAHRVGADR